jgi:hypothetical protein
MLARLLLACLPLALPLVSVLAAPRPSAKQATPDAEVVLEVGFIVVSDDVLDRLGIDFSDRHEGGLSPTLHNATRLREIVNDSFRNDGTSPTLLDSSHIREFLKEVQVDRKNFLRVEPKIRVSDGKTAEVRCMNQLYCLSGIDIIKEGGQTVFHPRCSQVETGLSVSIRPMIVDDRRAVRINLQASLTSVDTPLYAKPLSSQPITSAPPELEKVLMPPPMPLLGFTQDSPLYKLTSARDLIIPDGGTALVGCWRQQRELIKASTPFTRDDVPSMNRQIKRKNGGTGTKTDNILVLVTARIAPSKAKEPGKNSSVSRNDDVTYNHCEPETSRSDVAKKGKVAKLLALYHKACSEGRLGEAKKLAHQAIELDPICFEKPQ